MLARFEELDAHVDQLHLRHRPGFHAIGQLEQRVLAALRVVAAFEAGRGAAQYDAGSSSFRPNYGDVAAVVAGIFFLLIALIVLFIHHYKPQIAHGSKDAGASSHHYGRRSRPDLAPLLGALGIAEGAVQDRNFIAEAPEKLAGHCRCQRDLGEPSAALRGPPRVSRYRWPSNTLPSCLTR